MKTVKLALLCFLLLSFSHHEVKCGLGSIIEGWFQDQIDSYCNIIFEKIDKVAEDKIKAFREALNYLFDSKLLPMINQIDAVVHRNLGNIDEMIQGAIESFKERVISIVKDSVEFVWSLAYKSIEWMKTKIIDNIFDKVTALEQKIIDYTLTLLDKIDEIIYKLSCKTQAVQIKVREAMLKKVPLFYNPFERCRVMIDGMFPGKWLRWKFASFYQPKELFELRKCYIMGYMDENTPIKSVLMGLRDLEFLTAEMRCLSTFEADTEETIKYVNDMADIANKIDLLEKLNNLQSKAHTELVNLK